MLKWQDVVDFSSLSKAILRATHLAEGVEAQVALTNLGPTTVVALVMSFWSLVVIVIVIHDLSVLLAVSLMSKLGAARIATRFLWCVRHKQASFLRA